MKSLQSEPATTISFKSKKPLLTTTPKKEPVPSPSVDIPERINPPTRIRNQNFALSVSEVRRSALNLLKSKSDLPDKAPLKLTRSGSADEKPKVPRKSPTLLPEKHEILCEFFDAMISSLRLFRLKSLTATFSKLSRDIESLTDRRFTLRHLAQLEHIMPEVIVVQKTRVLDEETSCMKEDLVIKLEVDAMEADKIVKGPAVLSQLKGIFKSRITAYSTSHPEDDDIPEEELPHLFWRGKLDPKPTTNELPISLGASLISPLFRRHFSLPRPFWRGKLDPKPTTNELPISLGASRIASPSVSEISLAKPLYCLLETPIKVATCKAEDGSSSSISEIQSTPVALASTPAKLAAATPALRTPKRTLMSQDDHTNVSSNRAKRRRSLKYDESDVDIEDQSSKLGINKDKVPANKDVFDILPEGLLQSVRDNEMRFLHEQDPVVSKVTRRQQLMASVPKLYGMICIVFRSIRRSVITKEELIYKLIEGNLDIVDRKEVEEQLVLLLEIAPKYISELLSLSGHIFIRLNNPPVDSASIRAKPVDAKSPYFLGMQLDIGNMC